jgi:hypothetical protein
MKLIFSKRHRVNNSIIIPILCLVGVSVLLIYSLCIEDTKAVGASTTTAVITPIRTPLTTRTPAPAFD